MLRLRSLLHTLARFGLRECEGRAANFTLWEAATVAGVKRVKVFLRIFPCSSVPSAVCLRSGAKGWGRSSAKRRSQAASSLLTQDRDPLPAAGIRVAPSSRREVAEDPVSVHRHR